MKLAHGLRHWYLPIVVVLVLTGVTIGSAPVFAQSGSASSSAIPSGATPSIGQQIEVEISIDVSAVDPPDNALGSFTASLDWDPAVLAYASNSGILAGFTGMVNVSNVSSGHVVFNGANPSGATGNVTVIRITFDVIGVGSSDLDLEYSAMAAAYTFGNLLPLLTVNDGLVQVSPAQYTLAVAVEGSGSVTLNPSGGTYDEGTEVQLTAVPAAGYEFDHWSGDLTGSANPTTITMDEDKTVTAHFTRDEYTLAVSVSGNGSVSKDPDQTSYTYGEKVKLTAVATAGWTFDHWSGDLTGNANPATITMDGNKTITATFTEEGGGTLLFQVFLPYIATDYTATFTERDGNPPVSWVSRLRSVQYSPAFTVRWMGAIPGGPGIQCYDVQFRDGYGPWQSWQTCTTATSDEFYGQRGHMYSFRSRATDNAGNVEAWPSGPDTWTYVWPWTWWRR